MSMSRKVMRGEIYYVHYYPTAGHEQRGGRPAIIVSNNENNEHSSVYEVCYLTLQDKPNLPTHVYVDRGPCVRSTILCEQICSVSEDKLGDFLCRIPESLEGELNNALRVSLGLNSESTSSSSDSQGTEIVALKHHLDVVKQELDVAKNANEAIKNTAISTKKELESALARAEMFENMYNTLLEKLISRG